MDGDNQANDRSRIYDDDEEDVALQEMCVVSLVYTVCAHEASRIRMPQHNIGLRGDQYIQAVLNGHPRNCREMFRMEVEAFRALCDMLRGTIMNPTERTSVEESIAMFCLMVGHAHGQRIVGDRFQHSSEIVCRHIWTVMRALHDLRKTIIAPIPRTGVHPYIAGNQKNYPWFEKCLGAIDGTFITAVAPKRVNNAFLNRHQQITQNVLCACDFDMRFTFVYTGWEGTAHDARVFLDALTRHARDFPWPSEGHYYLVDSAFPCIEGFMPPYPRVRYHYSERYSERTFRGYKDYFNYRHASIRGIIERTFGLLKHRFKVLDNMSRYKMVRQGLIVTACCTLHNYIKMVTPDDWYIREAMNRRIEINHDDHDEAGSSNVLDMSSESARRMAAIRDGIAVPMWAHKSGQ